MVHLILTGATGLVGSSVLLNILSLPPAANPITRLTILSRSPVPLASKQQPGRPNTTQIEVISHTDYASYPPDLLAKLKGAHGVIWAQGISQTEVDKPTYTAITKDYPVAAAKAFANLNSPGKFNFVYVSGEGVTHRPGRFTQTYSRVKGEAELALLALAAAGPKETDDSGAGTGSSNINPIIVRPGGVDGQAQPEIWDPICARRSAFWKASMLLLLPPVRMLAKNMHSPTKELGKVLTELAMREETGMLRGVGVEGVEGEGGSEGEGEGWIVRNRGLRRMGGLSY